MTAINGLGLALNTALRVEERIFEMTASGMVALIDAVGRATLSGAVAYSGRQTATQIGTPAYAAPEQVLGRFVLGSGLYGRPELAVEGTLTPERLRVALEHVEEALFARHDLLEPTQHRLAPNCMWVS